ncbi:MAG: polymer-forming cytoskeletal protein [Gemmatimonadota bacterium]|jgi:cytoskeletal protein CcmA (bactofilin family)
MARETAGTPPESVISIIGPGMKVVGDCKTEGTVRIEGHVEGSIQAGKAVVIGKAGRVVGDVITQDAVISGHVVGTLVAESRLELQATCHIDGEVRTRRMQLEEGAVLNGTVEMGDKKRAASGAQPGPSQPGKPAQDAGANKPEGTPAPAGR